VTERMVMPVCTDSCNFAQTITLQLHLICII